MCFFWNDLVEEVILESTPATAPLPGGNELSHLLLRRRSAMAVINRNTLVLTGVSVVRDVVTGAMGTGLNVACAELSRSPISTRHPSQRYPQAEQKTGQRLDHAESGMDDAAYRAGRPGCREGLLASRGLALPASLTTGGACS